MSIAQIITISLSLIKSGVTIVYIGKEFESMLEDINSTKILTYQTFHLFVINSLRNFTTLGEKCEIL